MEEYTYTNEEIDLIVAAATTAGYKAYLRATADLPPIPISHKFKRWMRKTIRDLQRTPAMRRTVKVSKRIAIAFVAALVAAAMTIMTVSAAREWFISLINSIIPGERAVTMIDPSDDIPDFVVYAPSYLPVGYTLVDRDVNEAHRLAHQTYYRDGNPDLEIMLSHYQRGSLKYDHSGDEIGVVYVNGDESTYSRKGDRQMMGWTDGVNFYRLTCFDPDVSKNEMIKIAESIAPELVI